MNVFELHSSTWEALLQRRERLPHALLLSGQAGLGKIELARAFAQHLLCEQSGNAPQACGHCQACHWFSQGNHPDYRELQPDALLAADDGEEGSKKASQQITIDQVRSLDDFLSVGTHRGGLRIIVVNPAEAMNRSTANALLKSLEEPPPSTLFLLVSSEASRILPTLRSRCQRQAVPVPAAARAVSALREAGISDPESWLALAGGAPKLARQLASGDSTWLEPFLRHLGRGRDIDPLGAAGELEKLLKDSKGRLVLRQFVDGLQKWLVDLTLCHQGLPSRYFLRQRDTMGTLAAMIPATRLIGAYRQLAARRREAEQPLNSRLFLETLLLDYRALYARLTP